METEDVFIWSYEHKQYIMITRKKKKRREHERKQGCTVAERDKETADRTEDGS